MNKPISILFVEEEKEKKEEVKAEKKEEPQDHWKAQLAELSKQLKAKEDELKKIRDAEEQSKLSAEEKRQREIQAAKDALAEKEKELAISKQKSEDLLLTSHLIAEYNLASPDFGPVLLAKYDRNEKLDDFAKRMIADPVYSRFFKAADSMEVPRSPGTTHTKAPSKKGADIITQADKDFAASMWRNYPEKQKLYLENLKKERAEYDRA